MKKSMNILGVDVKIRNEREYRFARILQHEIDNCVQWMDNSNNDYTIINSSDDERIRIANSITNRIDEFFSAMYFLDMIKEPQAFNRFDIMDYYSNN